MDPVVVVGGGIVGASVAYHLSAADVPVILCERDALGSGTTADSVAMFIWEQTVPDETAHRLRERSWETYGRLVDEGTIEFSRIGGLYPARSEERLERLRAVADTLEPFGVRTRLVEPADLQQFGLAPDDLIGALSVPAEGYLDPTEVIQFFVSEARAAGARVETGAAVTDVLVEDGAREDTTAEDGMTEGVVGVEVDGERVPASAVVNAAGPWAPTVDAMAGVDLPLRHNLGPILVLGHETDQSLPFVEFEDGHYVRGEGRAQAFAGRYGVAYEAADRVDPDAARSVDQAFSLAVADRLERYLPRLVGADLVNDWVGVRTITPDGRPFVGETRLSGYHVASGMNGLGVTLAPAVGEHLASVVTGGDPDPAFREYLSPTRFESSTHG